MFDLRDAKRIRRSHLNARSASSSPTPSTPNPEQAAELRARLASLFAHYEYSRPEDATSKDVGGVAIEEEDGEQEFEFRLFAGEAVQKVVLTEEVVRGDGGFVKMKDPRVWFVPKAEGERWRELESVATSGEEVQEAANRRAWGLEVPWRVTVLKVSKKSIQDIVYESGEGPGLVLEGDDSTARKKKPGKKKRIILRERKKKSDEIAEKMRIEKERKKIEDERKGENEKEKRARKNREKKLKRRAKEQALKASGGVITPGSGTGVAQDDNSNSDEDD